MKSQFSSVDIVFKHNGGIIAECAVKREIVRQGTQKEDSLLKNAQVSCCFVHGRV